jgi:hypothetical protein
MPLDLKFFETVGTQLVGSTWPNPDKVEGNYALVQRITKDFYTVPGDDSFDPGLGGDLKGALQGLSGQEVQAATKAVTAVVTKVLEDLLTSTGDDEGDLKDLRLRSVTFDLPSLAWLIELDVVTRANEFTLTLPNS